MVNLFWLHPPRNRRTVSLPVAASATPPPVPPNVTNSNHRVPTPAPAPVLVADASLLDYSHCVREMIDAHIVKIPSEATGILYTAHYRHPVRPDWLSGAPQQLNGERGYRPSFMHNPLSKWVAESISNYRQSLPCCLLLVAVVVLSCSCCCSSRQAHRGLWIGSVQGVHLPLWKGSRLRGAHRVAEEQRTAAGSGRCFKGSAVPDA